MLFKCQPPLPPSPSSGFPPRLCNITAIIPIMTKFEALDPRHYPTASGSRLRIRCGWSCRRRCSVEYWKNADIFPRSIFSTESENHLKKSNETPPPRLTFRPHTLTWWSSADQCQCSVHFHWLCGILPWHSESQYLVKDDRHKCRNCSP